jgi:Spy/CpxP family protein refolding chaperone
MNGRTAATVWLSCLLLVGLVVLGTGRTEAETSHKGRGPLSGRWIEEHAERLGLDEETLTAIRTIADASHEKEEEFREALRKAYDTMRELLSQETPDEAIVMHQADVIGALELTKRKNRLRTLLRIRALLTPEQRQELVQMHEEYHARRMTDVLDACRTEVATFCAEATHWRARMQCLRDRQAELSEECRAAIKVHKGHRHSGGRGLLKTGTTKGDRR